MLLPGGGGMHTERGKKMSIILEEKSDPISDPLGMEKTKICSLNDRDQWTGFSLVYLHFVSTIKNFK